MIPLMNISSWKRCSFQVINQWYPVLMMGNHNRDCILGLILKWYCVARIFILIEPILGLFTFHVSLGVWDTLNKDSPGTEVKAGNLELRICMPWTGCWRKLLASWVMSQFNKVLVAGGCGFT